MSPRAAAPTVLVAQSCGTEHSQPLCKKAIGEETSVRIETQQRPQCLQPGTGNEESQELPLRLSSFLHMVEREALWILRKPQGEEQGLRIAAAAVAVLVMMGLDGLVEGGGTVTTRSKEL